eukprot:g34878.t1
MRSCYLFEPMLLLHRRATMPYVAAFIVALGRFILSTAAKETQYSWYCSELEMTNIWARSGQPEASGANVLTEPKFYFEHDWRFYAR